ncbi:MAG: hypothetical protein NTW25_07460 [Candidatus Kapabacteria bacterium]|nr:hypothetical protein [Candidatus Kapabacteria bacterium]
MLKKKTKYYLIIALILLCTSLSRADDYYDIPVGWEKLIEYESAYGVSIRAEKNQILASGSRNMYSNDNGKTFQPLENLLKPIYGLSDRSYFYNGKLCEFTHFDDGYYIFRYDIQAGTFDSVQVTKSLPASFSKLYFSDTDSTIIAKFETSGGLHSSPSQVCFISRNGGDNWEYLPLYRNNRNCNFYEIIFDMKSPGKWIYKTSDSDDPTFAAIEPDMTFITEDNGKTFKKKDLNIKLTPMKDIYNDTDDKYLSYDYDNSARGYLIANNLYTKGFQIRDLLYLKENKIEDLEKLFIKLFAKDTTKLNQVAIIYNNYVTNNLESLFQTSDNLTMKNNIQDTLYEKISLYNIESSNLNLLLAKNSPKLNNTSISYSTKILFFDKKSGKVFVEICQPKSGYQRRIIIRKQIENPSTIELQNEHIETITIKDRKIIINNEFIEPKILIFDLLGKQINYKISSVIPLSFELPDNLTYGIYLLKIEDKLKIYNYKLIFNN